MDKKILNQTKEGALFFIFTFATLCLLFIAGLNLHLFSSRQPIPEVLGAEKNIEEEISFWDDFLFLHPDYQPGWIQLSKLNVELGDLERARSFLFTAKMLGPNNEEVSLLENLLD